MDLPLRSNSSSGSSNGHSIGGGWNITGPKTEWQVSTPNDVHNPPSNLVSTSRHGELTYSPDGSNLVKLIMLGAPGVGKTSIIQQFVWGTFEPSYYPTGRKETYYPSVILHDQHYELKIVDIPNLPFFPVNSFYNLSDLQSYGLRDATAYILVFDLFCPDSFEYVSQLFSQISESRDIENIPIIVIGNKADKVEISLTSWKDKNGRKSPAHGGLEDSYHYPQAGDNLSTDYHHAYSFRTKSSSQKRFSHKKKSTRQTSLSSFNVSKHRSVDVWGMDAFFEKDIAEKVMSEWKAVYRECAAKDSESVTDLFKTIMDLVAQTQHENDLNSKIDKKCTIL